MRVLVCGGRDYSDEAEVVEALGRLHLDHCLSALIQGGARGADRLAAEWARAWNVPVETYEADWNTHGRSAGPRRNERMLRESAPDLVLAFPGGRGTADMVRRARAAGVEVQEWCRSFGSSR